MRILILGGTTQASQLARALAARPDIDPLLSLAGRTQNPLPAPIPSRTGGFGGVDGLFSFLGAQRIDAVIDATHPFAAQMSAHAREASARAGVALLVFSRPPWTPDEGDDWTDVANMQEAVAALGEKPRRVFLTQGRLQLAAFAAAPQHFYLVRAIDEPAELALLPNRRFVPARGPFALQDELALMREERIEILVSKNSGGEATSAKLLAARLLGVKVVLVARPPGANAAEVFQLDDVLRWIEAHRPAP
ncbi:cobalt-precorrin-6A reductase [uncultured Rhodoblastus sp.]|uniref:cobalt-precorrin-6A reductase n=1 Tax=uncultured Rhodoblastus sp. TaxID=543037 RepID=UPI0025E5F7C6|nr:cobalt-precorrin-6A reductase [uncultured Rhodoblastus sp.]